MSEHEQRSRRLAMHLEEDDYSDEDEISRFPIHVVPEQPITLKSDGHCDRLVLMSVLAPIAHTYVTVAETLVSLVNNVVPESDFIKECVASMKAKVESNQCRYGE